MKSFLKKNFAIILAFSLPVVLIVVVAVVAYLPSLFITTSYNFIYSSCVGNANDYYSYSCDEYLQRRYTVVNGRLVVNDINPTLDSNNNGIPDVNEGYVGRLFLHNTSSNESKEITVQEAQSLTLNELVTSPDGVSVTNYYDRGPDFLLLDGGSTYGYFLMKGNAKSKLNLIGGENRYYRDNIQFIGWILPGRN